MSRFGKHWWQRDRLWEPPFKLYAGLRGSMKTILAADMFLDRPKGQEWYANAELFDPRDGYRAGRIYSWEHLLQLEDCVVFIDEIGLWANVYEWEGIDSEVYSRWVQSRKAAVGLVMTATNLSRVAKPLRELIDEVVLVNRHPLRLAIDTRLPLAQVQMFHSVELAERVPDPENWRTQVVSRFAFDAVATGETQEMQIARRRGMKRSELPIRPPGYVDLAEHTSTPSASLPGS